MTTLELVEYYVNLLILQYRGKPKAEGSIATQTMPVLMPQVSTQTITFSAVPDTGAFTLSYGEEDSASIAFDDIASAVQAILRAMTGLDEVLVTGDFTTGFTVTFDGVPGVADLLETDSNTLTVNEIVASGGQDAVSEAWGIDEDYQTGGSFTLTETKSIASFVLKMQLTSAGTGTFKGAIWSSSGGLPDSVLVESASKDNSVLTVPFEDVEFELPIELPAGDYFFVISTTQVSGSGAFPNILYEDPVSGKNIYGSSDDGATWGIDQNNAEFYFEVYSTEDVSITITETDQILPLVVQDAFNLDENIVPVAIGAQLDVIGQYVGVTRNGVGFNGELITLTDSDYLSLIQVAITRNSIGSSLAEIQAFIQTWFEDEMLVFDYKNMTMSYLLSTSIGSEELAQMIVTQGLLPAPMAVGLALVIYADIITMFFGFRTYTIPAFNSTPFNSYTDYQTGWPWLSYSNALSS